MIKPEALMSPCSHHKPSTSPREVNFFSDAWFGWVAGGMGRGKAVAASNLQSSRESKTTALNLISQILMACVAIISTDSPVSSVKSCNNFCSNEIQISDRIGLNQSSGEGLITPPLRFEISLCIPWLHLSFRYFLLVLNLIFRQRRVSKKTKYVLLKVA